MSIDLEYAIKKDIRNNPVVRQIDRDQKREFYQTIGLAALLVAMLLFSAIPHFRIVTTGIEVEQRRLDLLVEESRQRRLRLELEQRSAPGVIVGRATEELGMRLPSPEETVVIERLRGPAPPSAVVAQARPADGRRR